MRELDAIVERISDAETLPVIVTEIVRVTNDPRSDADTLAEAVAKDPALSAKIIRTVNTSFFGFLVKAKDVQAAVVRLGMGKVRDIALGLGVSKLFSGPTDVDGYSRVNVWKHSVAVGILNEILVETLPSSQARQLSGEALLAGLVHDLGIILLDQYSHKRYDPLPALAQSLKEPLYRVERDEYGFDHAQLGAAVLKHWRFPDDIVAAVAMHHEQGPGEDHLLSTITAMSEVLATAKEVGYCDMLVISKKRFAHLAEKLHVKTETMAAVRDHFDARVKEGLEIFSVEGGR